MGETLEAWLNGWVLSLFGPEGLILFQAHPWLYASIAALLAMSLIGALVLWSTGRLLHTGRALALSLRLAASGRGRQCLRHARTIRHSVQRIRAVLHQAIRDKSERRTLIRILDGVSGGSLLEMQAQALRLIQRGNDRQERTLQARLDAQMASWNTMPEGAERERLTRDIAGLKHRLAQAVQANRQRDAWLTALEEGALAVSHLELELGGLRLARGEHLTSLRGQVTEAAERLRDLKQAHLELSDR